MWDSMMSLIFREPAPTSAFEDELEVEDDDGNSD
jgi:hypothetical protein